MRRHLDKAKELRVIDANENGDTSLQFRDEEADDEIESE